MTAAAHVVPMATISWIMQRMILPAYSLTTAFAIGVTILTTVAGKQILVSVSSLLAMAVAMAVVAMVVVATVAPTI